MNIVTVTVEVNQFWLKEHSQHGEDAFAGVKEALLEVDPEIRVEEKGCKLVVVSTDTRLSFRIRSAIKDFFETKYNMSIEDGDYRLTAKTGIAADPADLPKPVTSASSEEKPGDPSGKKPEEENGAEAPSSAVGSQEEDGDTEDGVPKLDIRMPDFMLRAAERARRKGYAVIMPELEAFTEELDTVVKNGKKFGVMSSVWSTAVLLSMDSGHGISTVTGRIVKVLEDNGFSFNSITRKAVEEVAIPEDKDAAEKVWNGICEDAKRYAKDPSSQERTRSANAPLAYCIDISACLGDVDKKDFYENIKRLSEYRGEFLYIFRIPYIEEHALRKMQQVLEDVFVVRELVIPPLSSQQLLFYLKYCLEERGVALGEDLDPVLEKLIAFEKKDGRFSGLKTIGRLTDDMVYKLLLRQGGQSSLTLDGDTLMDIYVSIKENEEDPEVLLSQLCGMENVKQTIDGIVAQIKLYKELKSSGKKLSAPTMHMRFVGSPGTGKTTVARLVAQIFKKNGILNKGYFYEIKARDLCGRYVGETAPKTSAYCRDALGSVLFIDEAYTLYRDGGRTDYGREAIDTLITEMENNRDNLVVIMAGYKKEMDELMEANSGLESRMPYEITFRNYTKDELVEIFFTMVGDDFSYTDGFDRAIRDFILSIPDNVVESEEFSNARMIRNLYERIWSKVAFRRQQSPEEELILTEDDVNRAIADEEFRQLLNKKTKTIGF